MKDNQIVDNIIPGLRLFEEDSFQDPRGYYWTVYNKNKNSVIFNHDKVTHSKKHVLRGIHGDFKTTRFISCIHGEIYCVIVDNRINSEFYHQWYWTILSYHNKKSIMVEPGFGLSYLITSDDAAVLYKLSYDDTYSDYDMQFTIKWNDPKIGIHWPIENPILSSRDKNAKLL